MTRLPLCLAALFSLCAELPAQTHENRDTEQLTVEELGPYRPAKNANLSAAAEEITSKTNAFRREHGQAVVSTNTTLQETAQSFAEYMARTDRYGHSADGRQPSERATKQGYDYCAVEENIAYQFRTRGYRTEELATQFFNGWKNSPGHRANMLRSYVTETGLGLAQSEKTGVYYAVQMFGRPKSEQFEFRVSNRLSETVHYQLGDRVFSLPPRVIRTHQLCQPLSLSLLTSGDAEAKMIGKTIEPDSGDAFVIRMTDDESPVLERKRKSSDGPTSSPPGRAKP